jgi:methionine salvage enolase-phosphatase E1
MKKMLMIIVLLLLAGVIWAFGYGSGETGAFVLGDRVTNCTAGY